MRRIVEKYKLMKYIRLRHELSHAAWDENAGLWRLRVRRAGEEETEDTADVLFLGVGLLNRPRWPDIPGLREFRGRLLHTAQWDVGMLNVDGSLDDNGVPHTWHDKVVGVIGNVTRLYVDFITRESLCSLIVQGSSGIQIVPALQPKVGSLVNFARSKTWISSSFALQKAFEILGREPGNNDRVSYHSSFG